MIESLSYPPSPDTRGPDIEPTAPDPLADDEAWAAPLCQPAPVAARAMRRRLDAVARARPRRRPT